MLHTKFRGNRSNGSVEDFCEVFNIYGHGDHLGHVTSTMSLNSISIYLKAYIQNLVQNDPLVSEKSQF